MVMRNLCASDVPSVATLIHSIGWQQTEEDLLSLVAGGTVIGDFEAETGELLSVAALQTFHEPSGTALESEHARGYSWLSYVATAPRARRRGLASALVASLLASAPAGVPIGLYGSADGAPLYASRFGFVDCAQAQLMALAPHHAPCNPSPSSAPRGCVLVPASEALDEIAALDARVYGVDRAAALRRWARAGSVGRAGWALQCDGEVVGFVLSRALHDGVILGPLVCRGDDEADALLSCALGSLGSERPTVQMLVLRVDAEAEALAARFGFERVGEVPARLMVAATVAAHASMPWLDRMPQARVERAPRPFAAAGYEFG
jgi:GNAT superfamily N-acetyltransferase